MKMAVVSRKGGVGKTMSAVHLAAFLSGLSGGDRTLMVDTDPSRNALRWSRRGAGFPFRVVGEEDAPAAMVGEGGWPRPDHVVVDVKGSPEEEDIEQLALRSDVLVIPAMPSGLSLDTLIQTIEDIAAVGREEYYRVLLTAVPPWPYRRGPRARAALERIGAPVFDGEIRRLEAFEAATETGSLVDQVSDRRAHKGWEDYVGVGQELVEWVSELRTRDLKGKVAG